MIALVSVACLVLAQASAPAETPLYRNPDAPLDQRVQDLVNRMTLDEKCSQLLSVAPAIPRLGVAAYNWWSECLHAATVQEDTHLATCFPQALAMAASWDPRLLGEVASAIADEGRARHHHWHANGLSFYGPNINIVRDPRWGRSMETYGEDPWLTSRLAIAFIRGLQGSDPKYLKAIATAKHYAVHSGPDETRFGFNVFVTPWDLRQTYLPHFRAAVVEGGVAQVMAAYNAVNGVPAAANAMLLTDILRKEWNFTGIAVSDCGGTDIMRGYFGYRDTRPEVAAACLNAGLDMDLCGQTFRSLRLAVDAGLTTEAAVTRACEHVMRQRFRLGDFDPPERVPYASIPVTVVGCEKHRKLALQMARASLVLLRNEGDALPLRDDIKRVLVVGPNADDRGVILSNYFWGRETALVTPLTALRERLKNKAEVTYRRACDWLTAEIDAGPVPPEALPGGLRVEYFANDNLSGKPALVQTEKNIDHEWLGGWPLEGKKEKGFSARWTGRIRFPQSGPARLVTRTDDGVRVYLDGERVLDDWVDHGARPTPSKRLTVEANRDYDLKVEYYDRGGWACAQLRWIPTIPEDPFTSVVREAADAVVVIAYLGHKGFDFEPSTEGEGLDRRIDLPEVQEKLLQAVAATARKLVLVLLNGGPTGSVWAQQHVPAILEAWYPGQEGGTAIAEALFGDFSPGGRLPVTCYRSEKDLPPFEDYAMNGRTYRFFTGEPLYAFGFGLSYTRFTYSNLKFKNITPGGRGDMRVMATVANSGQREGDEVVQAYATPSRPAPRQVRRQLFGFQRIHLKPGQFQTVSFRIPDDAFVTYDLNGQPEFAPGEYQFSIGGMQPTSQGNPAATSSFVTGVLRQDPP